MANKTLFTNRRQVVKTAPNTLNAAGGTAYSLDAKSALAKLACTGTLNNTFYTTAQTQLDQTVGLMDKVDTKFLCQLALYSRHEGYMKDMPSFIMAYLMGRGPSDLVDQTFHKVIDNGRMIRNFVQIIRSGQLNGRTSLGSRPKRLVQEWFAKRDEEELFRDSVGNDPSLADVIRLTHPNPGSKAREALFSYFIKGNITRYTPKFVKAYENWKADPESNDLPNVPHLMLTAHNLTDKQWAALEARMGYQALRMNLNTLNRHNVFKDSAMIKRVANRLRDKGEIAKVKLFPYQVMAAYLNREDGLPVEISNALQDVIDYSVENVPELTGDTIILVDVSGSMSDPIMGDNGKPSKVSCKDVAGLLSATILAKNQNNTIILAFDTSTRPLRLNTRDSVLTNCTKIATPGGGTNVGQALAFLNANNMRATNVIIISDNCSWRHFNGQVPTEWNTFVSRNKGAKIALIDVAPSITSVLPDRDGILNVGGFSDAVFSTLNNFFNGNSNFVEKVESYKTE